MRNLVKDKELKMDQLYALFEYATEGIIISNQKGEIVNANPSSERIFGYNPGELIGKVIEDLMPQRFSKNHKKHRENYNKKPHPRSMGIGFDLYGKRKNGEEFPIEISLTHFQEQDSISVIAFIIDITERKKIEENIKKINSELENKVKERTKVLQEALFELEQSKDQLSKALEKEKILNDMKSRFVTMASHEFRTPLSTILSSASLISKYKTEDDDEKRQKHVGKVKSAVTNMTLILNDFLSAERLQEGKIVTNISEFNIKTLVSEIINELQGLLKQNQHIEYEHQGNELISLDKQMVKNIFINFISNGIKFSPENKTIFINTKNKSNTLEIKVKDEGIGIPEDEQPQLFERFFRAKNVINIQGTGLGLSIVAKYVEEMKGTINFKSEINKGTEFNITIPLNNL